MKKSVIKGSRLAWLFAYIYFTSYVTRINFGAIIVEVSDATGFTRDSLAIILASMSVSYGLGQIINGRIGDKIRPENLIFTGLISASAINLLFPFCTFSLPLMIILWAVNGFAQAMLWPPMVRIMVNSMDEQAYGKSVVLVSLGSSVGTIAVYLISPLILELFSWKAVLFCSAAIGCISTVIWGLLKNRCAAAERTVDEKPETHAFPHAAVRPFLFIALAVVFQGMLRDGVTSWMPGYLTDVFKFGNSAGILSTVSLAVFSMIAFMLAGKLHRRFFKNEVSCAALLFAVALGACGILAVFYHADAIVAILLMTLMTGAVHGVNLMLITHVPKRFKKFGNISTVSGVVNSFTYLGAAIANYGIARLSAHFGWQVTVLIWLLIAILGTVCCLIAIPKWKKFIEE